MLLLHNTTGSAATWLLPELANELFASGRPLDARKYFLIAGDMIGFGGSSKPSDGLRAGFPHYRYADIAAAQRVVRIQAMAPTRTPADSLYRQFVERAQQRDANDRLYQLESSMDYDPSDALSRIKARVYSQSTLPTMRSIRRSLMCWSLRLRRVRGRGA